MRSLQALDCLQVFTMLTPRSCDSAEHCAAQAAGEAKPACWDGASSPADAVCSSDTWRGGLPPSAGGHLGSVLFLAVWWLSLGLKEARPRILLRWGKYLGAAIL